MAKKKSNRKLTKNRSKKNRQSFDQSNVKTARSSRVKVVGSLIVFLLTASGVFFQYFFSRPYIIVENIDSQSNNPWKSQFVIKNVGWSKAQGINISLTNFVIVDSSNVTYTSRHPEHPGTITGSSIIEGVDLLPQQQYRISPDEFIHFPKRIIVQEAVFTYEFEYHDFLHIVSYSDSISYRLFTSDDGMVWKAIGPNYQDLKNEPQAPIRRPDI